MTRGKKTKWVGVGVNKGIKGDRKRRGERFDGGCCSSSRSGGGIRVHSNGSVGRDHCLEVGGNSDGVFRGGGDNGGICGGGGGSGDSNCC